MPRRLAVLFGLSAATIALPAANECSEITLTGVKDLP
jgi:hypothetical protein